MSAYRDQHFLSDRNAVERIASVLDIADRQVLEIGPGRGVLTRALLTRGARVIAVELDESLVAFLKLEFSDAIESGSLTLIHGDATRVDIPQFEIVVANLPYSASSKITFRLLDIGFEAAVLMYQKEFADRMLADIGTRDCGRLSVMVQTFARASRCFDLPPGAFSPPPAVYSTVVRIEPRPPLFPVDDRVVYAEVVKILYAGRRKTVRSILKNAGSIFGSDPVATQLSELDPAILSSRPEALYLEDYATISNILSR
ncbi:MAG TPA: 16S rRNA (adenine(1518)-N(6)/adenine(1519)-N(6))-dimethyltransferase RsmA [Methanospirillum sp.]|uniref:16S rRNA (adenine(1518)-N(6)/adenine(1519)-N(6))- dimethyltransferase RsmA n=1 Tax=Methanospirillum sp. TaxID=45200 RepID=UPI002BF77CC6|nr:16S rRNA (adenine(1518)-N(6)/adenine(1519)-N(6))-dimethyltransferase RsmA [Methanospirillum sp.]HWQ63346.1 16S rRNA (adenine(1518)-N(6)/adenine(1519)-N(6))-dimethyltransferase RsmA [Methanospirillum sp.]